MTDDIRADPRAPVDLLIVGGLTIDVLDGEEVVGGAARYATEAALAAGLRVALAPVSGPEPVAREAVARFRGLADVTWHEASTSIVFEHHGAHDERRLRQRSGTEPIRVPEPLRLPPARAVLFAPVAGEVPVETIQAVQAPVRAAGLQGWLRQTDAGGWVSRLRLVCGRTQTLAEPSAASTSCWPASMSWAGTMGRPPSVASGPGRGPGPSWSSRPAPRARGPMTAGVRAPRPAEVVANRHTIGAGDAFAAVLAAQRGAGLDLHAATAAAARATARYLASREPTTIRAWTRHVDLTELDETRGGRRGSGLTSRRSPPAEAEFSLEIQGDRLAGRSGCNRYMGTWATRMAGCEIGAAGQHDDVLRRPDGARGRVPRRASERDRRHP